MANPIRQSRGSRSVRSRYTPSEIEAKLIRYLSEGEGHALIVGDDQRELRATLDSAIDRVPEVRVISLSGRLGRVDVLAELIAGSQPQRGRRPGREDIAHLFAEMADARSRGVDLVVVVEDADLASVQALESLRLGCEAFASNLVSVRIILLGGAFLTQLLTHPSLVALQSRVASQFSV